MRHYYSQGFSHCSPRMICPISGDICLSRGELSSYIEARNEIGSPATIPPQPQDSAPIDDTFDSTTSTLIRPDASDYRDSAST